AQDNVRDPPRRAGGDGAESNRGRPAAAERHRGRNTYVVLGEARAGRASALDTRRMPRPSLVIADPPRCKISGSAHRSSPYLSASFPGRRSVRLGSFPPQFCWISWSHWRTVSRLAPVLS